MTDSDPHLVILSNVGQDQTEVSLRLSEAHERAFVAGDRLLHELEERLYQWRIDNYGLVRMEITAKELREGDIIPGIGMIVTETLITKKDDEVVIIVHGGSPRTYPHVCLGQHHMLTIHRRVQ